MPLWQDASDTKRRKKKKRVLGFVNVNVADFSNTTDKVTRLYLLEKTAQPGAALRVRAVVCGVVCYVVHSAAFVSSSPYAYASAMELLATPQHSGMRVVGAVVHSSG